MSIWTPRFISRSFQVLFGPSRYWLESSQYHGPSRYYLDLPDIDYRVRYLWQAEAPKKVLWSTFFLRFYYSWDTFHNRNYPIMTNGFFFFWTSMFLSMWVMVTQQWVMVTQQYLIKLKIYVNCINFAAKVEIPKEFVWKKN